MTIAQDNALIPAQPAAALQNGQDCSPVQGVPQLNLEALTPLQLQRLDTAVMMLVNYLVTASNN
jgi:hypothetical protein